MLLAGLICIAFGFQWVRVIYSLRCGAMATGGSSTSLGSSLESGGSESCDISGMAEIWDAVPQIRTRLRDGHPLFGEVSDRNLDIKTPSKLSFVMKPLLERMREHCRKLPSIDALRDEVKALYTLCRVEYNAIDAEASSWSLRKHAGFIKMKVRKEQVSIAS